MAFIIPHKSDLIVDGQIIRQQLIENFKSIEQEESQLRDDLNDETDERKSADSDERNARINGDINERNSRINADNIEHDARIEADGRLQSQIDAIIQRLDKNEKNIADLQTRMKTAEDHIKKLDDIIFGMEYINDTDEIPLDDSMRPITDEEINDTEVINDTNAEVNDAHDYVTFDHEIN